MTLLARTPRTRLASGASSWSGWATAPSSRATRSPATPARPCAISANATSSRSRLRCRSKRCDHAARPHRFSSKARSPGRSTRTTYRSEPDNPIVLDELILARHCRHSPLRPRRAGRGAERGRILGEAINFARTLALTPANDMTPTHLADAGRRGREASTASTSTRSTRSAWRRKGMGSILGVSRGSDEEARMIVLDATTATRRRKRSWRSSARA